MVDAEILVHIILEGVTRDEVELRAADRLVIIPDIVGGEHVGAVDHAEDIGIEAVEINGREVRLIPVRGEEVVFKVADRRHIEVTQPFCFGFHREDADHDVGIRIGTLVLIKVRGVAGIDHPAFLGVAHSADGVAALGIDPDGAVFIPGGGAGIQMPPSALADQHKAADVPVRVNNKVVPFEIRVGLIRHSGKDIQVGAALHVQRAFAVLHGIAGIADRLQHGGKVCRGERDIHGAPLVGRQVSFPRGIADRQQARFQALDGRIAFGKAVVFLVLPGGDAVRDLRAPRGSLSGSRRRGIIALVDHVFLFRADFNDLPVDDLVVRFLTRLFSAGGQEGSGKEENSEDQNEFSFRAGIHFTPTTFFYSLYYSFSVSAKRIFLLHSLFASCIISR